MRSFVVDGVLPLLVLVLLLGAAVWVTRLRAPRTWRATASAIVSASLVALLPAGALAGQNPLAEFGMGLIVFLVGGAALIVLPPLAGFVANAVVSRAPGAAAVRLVLAFLLIVPAMVAGLLLASAASKCPLYSDGLGASLFVSAIGAAMGLAFHRRAAN